MSISKWLLFFLLGLVFVGCSNEDKVFQELPVAKVQGITCLTDAQEIFSKYFGSQMSESEVKEFWDCTDRAVRLFGRYVQGDKSGKHSSREIYNFVNQYFFSKLDIPDDQVNSLLAELMKLKRVLIGGDDKYVTASELVKFRGWIQYLKEETILLRPYISTLNWLHGKKDYDLARVNQAKDVLDLVAKRLGERLAKENIVYRKGDIQALFAKMDVIFASQPEKQMNLERWVPLAFHIKEALVGDNSEAMEPGSWAPLIVNFSRGFGIYLIWNHSVSSTALWYDSGAVSGLEAVAKDGLRILQRGVEKQKNKTILNSTVLEIFKDLESLEILPEQWTSGDLSHLWLVVVSQVLSKEFKGRKAWVALRSKWLQNKRVPWEQALANLIKEMGVVADEVFPSLDLSIIQKVEAEIERWVATQKLINKEKNEFDKRECLDQSDEWFNEMVCLTKSPWALNLDSEGRLLFKREERKYSWATLSTLNWERAAMRSIIHGYGDVFDSAGEPSGVSKSSLESVFFDFKPALVKLGLVDSENLIFSVRIFLEGNLFLSRSDGDISSLSFNESVEYLHYALAGVNAATPFLDLLKVSCESMEEDGKLVSVAVDCFRWKFKENFKDNFSHIAELVEFVQTLPADQWDLLQRNLELTVRSEGAAQTPILTSDIVEIFILLQYIETFMFRFDLSESGTIELEETDMALGVFAPTLGSLLGFDPVTQAWDLEVLFTYLLNFGESPMRDDPIASVEYLYWKWHPEVWSYRADRLRMAQILASLAKLQ